MSLMHVSRLLSKPGGLKISSRNSSDFGRFIKTTLDSQSGTFRDNNLNANWFKAHHINPMERMIAASAVRSDMTLLFTSYNTHFLMYQPNPRPLGVYQTAINEHVVGDASHSNMFIRDWETLGIDNVLEWSFSDYMQYIMARETDKLKRGVYHLCQIATDNPHPYARFASIEATEMRDTYAIALMTQVAERATALTGDEYYFWGHHHLDFETGHIHGDELFHQDDASLNEEKNRLTEMYGVNQDDPSFHKHMVEVAKEIGVNIERNIWDGIYENVEKFHKDNKYFNQVFKKSESDVIGLLKSVVQSRVLMREDDIKLGYQGDIVNNGKLSTLGPQLAKDPEALAGFLRSYALIDVAGLASLCRFHTWFKDPINPDQRLANEVFDAVSGIGEALIHDWKQLGLNEFFPKKAAEFIKMRFVEPKFGAQRENLLSTQQVLLRNTKPEERLAILKAKLNVLQSLFEGLDKSVEGEALWKNGSLLLLNQHWFKWFQSEYGNAISEVIAKGGKDMEAEYTKIFTKQMLNQLEALQQ